MSAPAAAVFLDRDGTLIIEKEYLSDPAGVVLEEGVIDGLTQLQHAGHPLIVVSNQSGIGRGFFTENDARLVNERLAALLRKDGIDILAWYVCPHAPDVICECRKPAPGMALAAAREWGLALAGCYVVGDKKSDLELADAIGGTGILVTTGHGRNAVAWARAESRPVFDGLRDVAEYIGQRHTSDNWNRSRA
jgi:D-glycero-D-manno-heptose 1,7-bisphosphate phosphatase